MADPGCVAVSTLDCTSMVCTGYLLGAAMGVVVTWWALRVLPRKAVAR